MMRPGAPCLILAGMLAVAACAAVAPLASGAPMSDVGTRPAQLPSRTGIWPVNFTFFGDASRGWGLNDTAVSDPGPTITVYRGDVVNLTLAGLDGLPHTWFVDYDNNSRPDAGEPASPDFNTGTVAVLVWEFIAERPGTWPYRCAYHPGSMTGVIRVLADPRPVNIALHGDAGRGWGFSNATTANPGPTLVILWGTNVTLTLIGADATSHNWLIDYDRSGQESGADLVSPTFSLPSARVVTWDFTADRTGNWTYLCGFHPFSMKGSIEIVGGPVVPPEQGVMVPLISAIMVGALVVVLAFAGVYHMRAVRASKRRR